MTQKYPVGGELVLLINEGISCRVKSSNSRTKTVTLFIPSGLDADGDVIFEKIGRAHV